MRYCSEAVKFRSDMCCELTFHGSEGIFFSAKFKNLPVRPVKVAEIFPSIVLLPNDKLESSPPDHSTSDTSLNRVAYVAVGI